MLVKAQLRVMDDFGLGHYGAPRGSRTHRGNDYVCMPNSQVYPSVPGEVTKLGYVYGDTPVFRYVEIKSGDVYARYMYVEPSVRVGDFVGHNLPIGHCQNIAGYHMDKEGDGRSMLNHVHIESFKMVDGERQYFDSKELV